MSKIADLMQEIAEANERPLSLSIQRMIKGGNNIASKDGANLKNKLKQVTDDLKQVQKEAKGLDHKTATKLQSAISDLGSLAYYIDQHGLKAAE